MVGLRSLSIAERIGAVALIAVAFVLLAGGVGSLLLDRQNTALEILLSERVAHNEDAAALTTELRVLQEQTRLGFLALFCCLVSGSLAAAGLVSILTLRVSRTIAATAEKMNCLASGDFDIDLPENKRNDELGTMTAALRHFAGAMHEVSEARDRMRELSISDPLTKLLNRRGMDEQITTLLGSGEPISILSVMHIDLDHFKAVNDTFGHDAGDHVLMVASKRMRQAVREQDMVSRVGGDEFVVLLPGLDDLGRLAQIASRLISNLNQPIEHQGRICQIGASVGIAIGGAYHEATDPERLLKDADLAVFQSKAKGRGRFSVFDHRMRALMEHQQSTAIQLRKALDSGHIEAWLQPVVNPSTGRILSVEALARWRDPTVGLVPAEDFIEVARQRNLLSEIGAVVLESAAAAVAAWPQVDAHEILLSMNLSVSELNDPQVVDRIRFSLDRTGLAPERLAVEVPLDKFGDRGAERAIETTGRLRRLGVSVILDGLDPDATAPSDLSRLPAFAVKLPGALVETGPAGSGNQAHLARMVNVLKSSGLAVYFKSLSTEIGVERALGVGVDGLQGYHIMEPVEASVAAYRFFPEAAEQLSTGVAS